MNDREPIARLRRFSRRHLIGSVLAVGGGVLLESADLGPEVNYNESRRRREPNLGMRPDWTKGSLRVIVGILLMFSAGAVGIRRTE